MPERSRGPRRKKSGRSPLVLIIEEEESIRALLHRILEGEGWGTLAASNVAEATFLLPENPETLDLVIADLAEPGVRGPDGLIHRLAPTTKLLLLSLGTMARADPGEEGETPYLLHRPFQPNALRDRVRALLGDLCAPDEEDPSAE